MSIQTGQLLNATLPSATAITHRSCNHLPLQNVVFFWTAQRAERMQWKKSGSKYFNLLNEVENAPVRSTSVKTKTKKHPNAPASPCRSATRTQCKDAEP
jgi:ribosomal protein L23